MNPVSKAIWFIESHLTSDLTLEQIAAIAGVSRYHMGRVFGVTTGRSVMRYVRARRLSEAARALADGAPDILMVALDAGYGSHEAFTRAFRERFGVTPESVRRHRGIENISMMEPIKMGRDSTAETATAAPGERQAAAGCRTGRTLHMGDQRHDTGIVAALPCLPRRHPRPGRQGGLWSSAAMARSHAGNFDYIAGVEVADFSSLPGELSRVRIPEQRYRVFGTPRPHRNGPSG